MGLVESYPCSCMRTKIYMPAFIGQAVADSEQKWVTVSPWMVQLRPLMEFVFFVGEFILPRYTPAKHFRQATQIVITLNNQNNATHT